MYDEEYTKARQDDIDEMNKTFDEGVVMIEDEPKPKSEPEPEPEPKSESEPEPEPEPEPENEPEGEPSKEPEGDGEPEPKPEPEPEPDEKDKIIEELRAELVKVKEPKTPEEPKEPEPEPKPEEIKFEAQDFVSEEDFDEITSDRGKFNEWANGLYQKTVLDTRKILGEGVLRSIPEIVNANVMMQIKLREAHDKFYDDNEDLKPYKPFVGPIFEEVMAKNPGKSFDDEEVLESVAKETRSRLRLAERATEKEKEKVKAPKLPRKKGSSGKAEEQPKTDPLLEDIDAMNKSIRR